MSAPVPSVYQNGVNQVSGDQFNSFIQWCVNAAQLRNITGLSGMTFYMQGFNSAFDGGQGLFYWNSSSTAADDNGVTTVVPNGSLSGAWTRVSSVSNSYLYIIPTTGFSVSMQNYVSALILDPSVTLATGSILLPATLLDGQNIAITSSQTITSLAINVSGGQTVYGAPSSISSTTPVKFIYRLANKTFYRTA